MAIGTDTVTIYRGEVTTLSFGMSPSQDITDWAIEVTLLCGTRIVKSPANLDDPTSGIFSVTLTATETATLAVGTGGYCAWRIDSGSERVLAAGKLVVNTTVRAIS